MKTILIDQLVESNTEDSTQEQTSVTVEGLTFTGYQIAKPLNYEKQYTSFKERFLMALKVLKGQAIAVQYFSDLSDSEKIAYVKTKITSQKVDNGKDKNLSTLSNNI